MKDSVTKITAICLCVLLAIGGIGGAALAINNNSIISSGSNNGVDEEALQEKNKDENTDGSENTGIFKDETVYVLAGADGSVQKIIVSDWIRNSPGSDTVNDISELTDVENVKGDEAYTVSGDNMRVWDAEGNDIYCQGNIEKELPVGLSVSYKLDGKPISAEDLAGKSGRVTIRFDYDNRQYENVEIDGRQEKIYVPFAMLTGVLLSDDVFRNVDVTNGKMINDGSRTAVIGIAFPGLQENLAISKDKQVFPDYVEISADTDSFRLDMTVTLATNEIFSRIDPDGSNSVSELSASMDELIVSMDQLTGAMDQLLDGSSQLYDGLATLLERSDELVDGIDKLAAGAESLKSGAGSLDSGAAELQAGATALCEGLNTLAANNDTLNGGAKQVFDTLLSTADTQLAAAGLDVPALTVENYAEVLNSVIASLDENAVYEKALSEVTAAVEAQRDMIREQVTAAVRDEVTAKVTAAVREEVTAQVTEVVRNTVAQQVIEASLHMDKASYDAAVRAGQINKETQEMIEAAIDRQMQSEQIRGQIQAETDRQMATKPIQDTIAANADAQMQSAAVKQTITEQTELQIKKIISEQMASDDVQAQLAAAAEGAGSVIALKTSLDSYNVFYLGLQSYTAGVADAAAGAGTLKSGTDALKAGTSELYEGASELYDGILTLKNGTPALTDGITQLRDGAMQLSEGLREFNNEAIQKLVNAVDGDIAGLLTRLRATRDVSLRYNNFAGIGDGMDGRVKFIYRTDSIG